MPGRCPQHIDISENLKAVGKELGGEESKAMLAAMMAKMASNQKGRSKEET